MRLRRRWPRFTVAVAIAVVVGLLPFVGPAAPPTRGARPATSHATRPRLAAYASRAATAAGTTCDGIDVTTGTVDLSSFPDLRGDGTSDAANELILQCIFTNVLPGTTILVPRGATYAHSSSLLLGVDDVTIKATGTGPVPALESTDAGTAACPLFPDGWNYPGPCLALIVTGNGDNISDLLIVNRHPSTHGTTPTQHGVVLTGDGQTLTNVTVYNSDGAGIETLGATHLYLDHPTFDFITGTGLIFHPGGIDGTRPTSNVFVQDPTIVNPGDDGICVESYRGGSRNHDIWINGENYTNNLTSGSHGLTVAGGNNIFFTNFSITGSTAAGIYLASGQVWGDSGSSNVKIAAGTITNANTQAPAGLQNGAVLVWSDATSPEVIDHVLVENVTIADTTAGVNYQVGDFPQSSDTPAATNVEFKNITFTGNTRDLLFTGSTPSSNYWTLSWSALQDPSASFATIPDHSPGTPPFAD